MTLPALLTSLSAAPPIVLEKFAVACCTAVNLKVCVIAWALAAVGSRNAPVPPRATAVPIAAMDARSFMMSSVLAGILAAGRRTSVMTCSMPRLRRRLGRWAQDMDGFLTLGQTGHADGRPPRSWQGGGQGEDPGDGSERHKRADDAIRGEGASLGESEPH